MDKSKISLVTMFFDIGRGDWSIENGHAPHLHRNNDKYFEYFSNLAKLENDLTVFTSQEFESRIRQLRQDRPTNIVVLDIDKKFKNLLGLIRSIQKNPKFIQNIPEHQLENPEYWSPKYVLITNLKTFFINHAIKKGLTSHTQIAWVDFGYCRDENVLGNINYWSYAFDPKYLHFFTIKPPYYLGIIKNPHFPHTVAAAYEAIYQNKATIIGGVIVGTSDNWQMFYQYVVQTQKKLLANTIVDDDQGIFVLTRMYCKKLIKLHFLGRGNWFGVFKNFSNHSGTDA